MARFSWPEGPEWACDGYKRSSHETVKGVIRIDMGTEYGECFWCPECLERRVNDLLVGAHKLPEARVASRSRTQELFGYGGPGCYCTRCCRDRDRATCDRPHEHHVLYIDTGNGPEWLCSECFDQWIDSLMVPTDGTVASSPMLVDGESVTIDGITFDF